LPLFLLAPAALPETVASIANARLSIERTRAETGHSGDLPELRIERCQPDTAGCRQFAEEIGRSAAYFSTVRLLPDGEAGKGGPLSYTIRLDTRRGGEAIYVRLVHDRTGKAIHAAHYRARDLGDEASVAYEAVSFASRVLSANGRIYLHAKRTGTASGMMNCLQEADRRHLSDSYCLLSPMFHASTASAARAEHSERGSRPSPSARAL
jgi:hypothetical protein